MQRLSHPLQPGHYVLANHFVGTKLDRRKTGPGWNTKEGFKVGTRFSVLENKSKVTSNDFELVAPFTGYSMDSRVCGWSEGSNIVWATDYPEDMKRLLDSLAPDTSSSTWLSHAVERSYSMGGCAEEVLLALLDSGKVSKEEILSLVAEHNKKLDELEGN